MFYIACCLIFMEENVAHLPSLYELMVYIYIDYLQFAIKGRKWLDWQDTTLHFFCHNE